MPLLRGAEKQLPRRLALEDVCIRISCGVATGADAIFVKKTQELEPQLAAFARPTISGRELNLPGEIGETRYSMLVPYAETGSLLDEDELGSFRRLFARGTPSPRQIVAANLRSTKALVCLSRNSAAAGNPAPKNPVQGHHAKASFLDRPRPAISFRAIPSTTWSRMTPAIIDPLCDYLNSTEIAHWLSEHCQRAANGFLRLQSNVLKAMPIPDDLGIIGRKRHAVRRRYSHPESPALPSQRLHDDHAV